MSASPLRAVLFDCDGTLVSSQQFLLSTLQQAFDDFCIQLTDERRQMFLGASTSDFVKSLNSEMDAEKVAQFRQHFFGLLSAARSSGALLEPMFDGLGQAMQTLVDKGYLLAVVTNKSQPGLESVLKTNAIGHFFTSLHHADNSIHKPAPDMVFAALRRLGVDKENAVLVGDTHVDMHTARNAGVRAVGAVWAHLDNPPDLQGMGAVRVLRSTADLVSCIEELLP